MLDTCHHMHSPGAHIESHTHPHTRFTYTYTSNTCIRSSVLRVSSPCQTYCTLLPSPPLPSFLLPSPPLPSPLPLPSPPHPPPSIHRYCHLACEILTSEIKDSFPILDQMCSEDRYQMMLWAFLDRADPLNPLIGSFISKVLSVLLAHKCSSVSGSLCGWGGGGA